MIKRLRRKFILIIMLLVGAMLAAACLGFLVTMKGSLEQASVSVLERVIWEDETPAWSVEENDVTVSLPYFTVTVIPNGSAAIITSSQFYSLDDSESLLGAINAALEQEDSMGLLEDYGLRYLREATQYGWRLAFVDISYEQSMLGQAAVNTLLVGLAALTVLFVISVFLARWAVRPVERSWAQQRQFVADASHELKTPLTVILSNTDLLEEEELSDQARHWTENIHTGGAQMRELVEQLLLLARSDSDQGQPVNVQPVDLSDLAETAALMFEPVAFEAGKLLAQEIQGEIIVEGDPSRLKRLLDILLDNAVKYAAPGGQIRLSLRSEGRRALLTVSDQGTPLEKEELERIFQRFYRADEARSTQGFGLGLSIAQSIAQEHHGRLWAESDPEGWNHFYCSLPLA
ncbi:MAG: HAMP domain-containing histidine kinase [Clostridiales bacterium]|nr:HAMP domain-containing histidine kinase [Clostridiales bacterium]